MTDTTQPTDAQTQATTARAKIIEDKIRQKVTGQEDDIWNKQLGKMDLPDWLTKKTLEKSAYTAIGAIALSSMLGFCTGYVVSPNSGISPADHQKALKEQEQQNSRTLAEMERSHSIEKASALATIQNLQKQLQGANQKMLPSNLEGFDPWTTASIRTSKEGKRVLLVPYAYLATLDQQGRKDLFKKAAEHAHTKIGMGNETLAFRANRAYAMDGSAFPYKLVSIQMDCIDSDEKIADLEGILPYVETDLSTRFSGGSKAAGYRLNLVAGGAAGKGKFIAILDQNMDGLNTEANDMIEVAHFDRQ